MMPASISSMLSTAAGDAKEVTTIEGKTAKSWVTAPGSAAGSVVSETGSASETGSSNRLNQQLQARHLQAHHPQTPLFFLISFIFC